jgi:hypothetical protein
MVRESLRASNGVLDKTGHAPAPLEIICREMEKSGLCYTAAYAFNETGKKAISSGRNGLHLSRIFRANGATT